MIEIKGDIFAQTDADAICVTTNGVVKANGELVMGRGIAQQFAERYPNLPRILGDLVSSDTYWNKGNHVHGIIYGLEPYSLVSFPTKENWKDPSQLWLVQRSAKELVAYADKMGWKKIVLTRPGCGLGGLEWTDVKKVIGPILDDRFYIITP